MSSMHSYTCRNLSRDREEEQRSMATCNPVERPGLCTALKEVTPQLFYLRLVKVAWEYFGGRFCEGGGNPLWYLKFRKKRAALAVVGPVELRKRPVWGRVRGTH